ncbi:MAG TPA: hypothetical protein VKT19_06240 [Steroidobacteraceae bacterium]|nr:hypothetical protein [Steroidobacteraceae bacterium]
MHSVGTTVYSNARATFWTRPPSFVVTWPLLLGLLVLLLAAGAIALIHHLGNSDRAPSRLHRVRGLVP